MTALAAAAAAAVTAFMQSSRFWYVDAEAKVVAAADAAAAAECSIARSVQAISATEPLFFSLMRLIAGTGEAEGDVFEVFLIFLV